jgi:hypothetical protein
MERKAGMTRPAASKGWSPSEVAWVIGLVVVASLCAVAVASLTTLCVSDAAWEAWLALW